MAQTASTHRPDGRAVDQMRPVTVHRGWLDHAEGSALIEFGHTRVLCAATFQDSVPRWRRGSGQGWVTAEYAMLPRATDQRSDRESVKGRVGGRTHEISRLVGRSLRGIIDVAALGENTIMLDCDVLQADGGTRTASITGAYIALAEAVAWAKAQGHVPQDAAVLRDSVSAISVGIIDGEPRLDLPYVEDVRAETDMNVVVTGSGQFVEIQGTAEHGVFGRPELNRLLDLATAGTSDLARFQRAALDAPPMSAVRLASDGAITTTAPEGAAA
ncbi:MAG: ribonuclease PH [Bifidobacteriaceae bacterium]|jgi:ribonuclease PH|nr:ribonuclease PH [Bifidobacteriaceae bacterium]